jgi:tetratricopeptide (TPR) repeat protein
MNKEQFIKYVENPQILDANAAASLEELIQEFPYCQPARILHLKALHNEKSIHYPSKLKLSAAYAADRKALYKFIMQDDLIQRISLVEKGINEALSEPSVQAVDETEVSEVIDKKDLKTAETSGVLEETTEAAKEKKDLPLTEPSISDKENRDIQEIVNEGLPEAESFITPSEETTGENIQEPEAQEGEHAAQTEDLRLSIGEQEEIIVELENEILKEAISATLELTMNDIEFENSAVESGNKKGENEENFTEAVEVESGAEEKSTENIKNEKLTFSQWMKALQQQKVDEGVLQPEHKKNADTGNVGLGQPEENKIKPVSEVELKSSINEDKPLGQDRQMGLIEKFIKEEPKIRPKKAEFFSPVNMAKLSMVEDNSFVTETLAKVYAKQGNFAKAIKAFENLILKYPEKSAYFAAQIDELKEKNKNNIKK